MRRFLILTFVGILSTGPFTASGQESAPTQVLQGIEQKFETYYTGKDLTPEQRAYNENLKKEVLRGTFDIRELCRIALSPYWSKLSKRDQDDFVDLTTRLLERKAMYSKEHQQDRAKAKGRSYKTIYRGDVYLDPAKTQALSKTMVRVPSESLDIEINYKMRRVDGLWKIYDVIVDGASLLDNYCYQFCKITKEKGFRDLVGRMERKYREITGGSSQAGQINP